MQPRLIIISGLPASGKTTLSKRLSQDSGLPAFLKDELKELMADVIGFTDHASTHGLNSSSFQLLFHIAQRCLMSGTSVIIEGNFEADEATRAFLASVQQQDIPVYEILCHAQGEVVIHRFLERKRHPVHHTLPEEEVRAFAEKALRAGKANPVSTGFILEIDTTNPEAIDYQRILSFIRE